MVLSLFDADPYGWLRDSENTILWILATVTCRGMGSVPVTQELHPKHCVSDALFYV